MVYDPALRVVTPKSLYYKFFDKIDEFSKEQTKFLLKKLVEYWGIIEKF